MIDREVTTVIDSAKCTGCGRCVEVCPAGTLAMQRGVAVVTGDRSLSCGHCAAVCPVEAIRVGAIDPATSRYASFTADPRLLPEGEFDTAQLVRLMASRRSCRRFREKPVDRAVLDDLVKIGVTAPSGTNSQRWTFTLLPDRAAVVVLGDGVARFFKKTNRLAANPLIRNGLRLLGMRALAVYYRDYHQSVAEALDEWENNRRDRLFHGAPAAIVVGSRPGGSTSREDSLLASQNILLAAYSMGLGGCLIGFAVEAMKRDPRIQRDMGIPAEERVHAVIALGHPDEFYLRPAGRKKVVQRVLVMPTGGNPAEGSDFPK
jgi:nitroreductase/NAD-dependent dihydropyrimidine dehydrogenase PreA subunit